MNSIIASLLCFAFFSFHAHADKKLAKPTETPEPKPKVVTFLLPDGSPAKGIEVKMTSYSMARHIKNPLSKASYKTNDRGEIRIQNTKSNKMDFVLRTFVFDVPGYALHIQAYAPLGKIQLIKDQGFDGILVDEKGKPFKQTAIRVSQSTGLIWGQILIPKGTNSTTTNDKGEFTLRQMVLNNSGYICQANIVFADDKTDSQTYDWKYTFYDIKAKKSKERTKVVKTRRK